MNIKEKKRKYRQKIIRDLAQLTPSYKDHSDDLIISRLLQTEEYANAQVIFCYIGVGNEINTVKFIKKALNDGKTVCVPKCLPRGRLEARVITDPDKDSERGFFNLLEPVDGLPLMIPEKIDLVIVPCLSCDRSGNRIGRGSGYYDRFLPATDAKTIVLCWNKIMREDIPLEKHDIPVDKVISEA